MASKLRSQRGKQAGYLAGYFVLLLFSLSGLMLQGGMWLLVGALCWFGIVSCLSVSYIYRYQTKCLRELSPQNSVILGERETGD
jgi:hypothetical protein